MNKSKKTILGFGFEWTKWGNLRKLYRSEQELLDEFDRYGIPPDFFNNKILLDVGCGMGRYTYLAAKKGAKEVYGIDPSESIQSAKLITSAYPQIKIIKGDVFNLPFQENTFDSIMSIGVLHHTGDAHGAIKNCVRYIKKGGRLYLMLYEPRKGFKKYLSPLLRKITLKMPPLLLYLSCYVSCMIKEPFRHIKQVITKYPPRKFNRNVADTFDWYCCPHQSFHTKREIISLFKELGLKNVQITNPKYPLAVTIIGTK